MVPPAGTTVRADRLRALNAPQAVCLEELAIATTLETWLVHDEWWRPPGINRRYRDVILESGAHVVLFEDLNTGAWFLQSP